MSDHTDDRLARLLDALVSWRRFGKFVSVGVVGTTFDTVVLLTLVTVFGVLEELAVIAGIETAILVMFALNEGWTFSEVGHSGWRARARRLGRSHAVRAAGATVQFLVFVAVYRLLFTEVTVAGFDDGWLLVAKGSGIVCGTVVNYIFETLFTWRVQAV